VAAAVAKLRLTFDDGGEPGVCGRAAGWVGFVSVTIRGGAADQFARVSMRWLGIPTAREFVEMMRARSAPIKAVLLDQSVGPA